MKISTEILRLHEDMRQWRRHLHRFPETAFEETGTAQFIADKLAGFGLEPHRGLGKTGVVASLKVGEGGKKIVLRADMDALFIEERNDLPYKSRHAGKMHACGHDGHSAMLLGAAKYLADHRNFNGTVHFIFQPAEEGRAGARQMIEDGLFELFPTDCVFGLHNFPDVPAGQFAVRPGPMMAAFDCFEIRVQGCATHAAMPHLGNDVIVAAAQMVNALQTIVSRTVDPVDSAVVSVTQIHAGNTWNAIPDEAVIRGTFRCFKSSVQEAISEKLRVLIKGIGEGLGVTSEIVFNPENPGYPVTFNSEAETELALKAALAVAGAEGVNRAPAPCMGSEDFAFMLQEKPGCYLWIGNGASNNNCLLHNPHYDFNDDILPVGVAYWVKLVELVLGKA
ncbi:M20 aminoacylase family protein [Methylosarcina fibrata]|uniref:M20 aminoacylase family protein n=1 Tax=Methylosarcina fibrata TaxID=105972 RepID=UPI0003804E7E|nr:M20 aminoacylase family protein [Methylosarcina fibrata]